MKVGLITWMIAALVLVFNKCIISEENKYKELSYVGTDKCQSCHLNEYVKYKTSDHFHAMDTVSSRSVLGNFNNSFFVYQGDTSFFYQRNGQYFVRTADSTGVKKEFKVSFTFGWRPLQQYLVSFSDGRIQALPFCWDTRPKEKGGQHWFHIYNKEKVFHGDELFWMGYNQNWNYMCADCHTTNYQKNFDEAANTFHSKWNESRVSCESCHGPASGHLEWTKQKSKEDIHKGFAISLAAKPISWRMDQQKGTMQPQQIFHHDTLIETCARCHARATRFTDQYHHGQSLLQSHIPATVNQSIYYIDGQIMDEDYEYGSFLQSKMYSKGVTCINCHDPHSMQLKATGNALCSSCHSPAKFDGPQHTHHQLNTAGAECVNCHMPVTNYMVIDGRRDHSIRIPRPDHSLVNGTPNACNKCHTDKSGRWAADNFKNWYGDKLPKEKNYGELLYAVSRVDRESEPSLYELLASSQYPAIIKAGALEQFGQFKTSRINEQARNYLQSTDPNLRLNALKAMSGLPPETVLPSVAPLLSDPVTAVRMEAVFTLAPYYQQLEGNSKTIFETELADYLSIQRGLCHRPDGYLNQGIVLGLTGRIAEAEQVYVAGVKRFPRSLPFYVNLADMYRSQNQEQKAKEYIDKGLQVDPRNPNLHYALGLWFVRQKEQAKGIAELKKAMELNPTNASLVYGYAIALNSTGQASQAISLLEKFTRSNHNEPFIVDALISICQDAGLSQKAEYYASVRQNIFGY
jgi:predicted CXXCH cytochrome family protein